MTFNDPGGSAPKLWSQDTSAPPAPGCQSSTRGSWVLGTLRCSDWLRFWLRCTNANFRSARSHIEVRLHVLQRKIIWVLCMHALVQSHAKSTNEGPTSPKGHSSSIVIKWTCWKHFHTSTSTTSKITSCSHTHTSVRACRRASAYLLLSLCRQADETLLRWGGPARFKGEVETLDISAL